MRRLLHETKKVFLFPVSGVLSLLVLSVARLAWPPGSQWGWSGLGTRVAGAQLPLPGSDSTVAGSWLVSAIT